MFYIHQISCTSPQQTFSDIDLEKLNDAHEYQMKVIEPSYKDIPSGILRRMGKAVRIAVGTALPIIKQPLDGIIIGTANGGMEDCIKFLNQIVDYNEGMLTPGNFVQSTANSVAAQLGLMQQNNGYNTTHTHLGWAFENAAIDASMLLKDFPGNNYLLGSVDEISTYNVNINFLDGWYKTSDISGSNLYDTCTNGSIAGEGATMFTVNLQAENAIAQLKALHIFRTKDTATVKEQLALFLSKHVRPNEPIDLLISGENGDIRLKPFYNAFEQAFEPATTIARYKHLTGEYPTTSSFALWFACFILQTQKVPQPTLKNEQRLSYKNILLYNTGRGDQHSFMLVSLP